jgi:hypothetical protein
MIHLGEVPASSVLYIPFATYNSAGASVTITGLAVTDIEIYKNGSITQRASDAGYTLLDTDGIDFDGLTGIHGFSVSLADNTDAGFYAVGSQYWVVVSAITVDSQTVNFIAATFRICAAEDTAGYPVVTVKDGTGVGELNTSGGRVSADVARWNGTPVATENTAGVPVVDLARVNGVAQAATLDTIKTDTAAVKAKTDSLTFTVAGQVDANAQYVNDVQITGVGSEADPWGP